MSLVRLLQLLDELRLYLRSHHRSLLQQGAHLRVEGGEPVLQQGFQGVREVVKAVPLPSPGASVIDQLPGLNEVLQRLLEVRGIPMGLEEEFGVEERLHEKGREDGSYHLFHVFSPERLQLDDRQGHPVTDGGGAFSFGCIRCRA